MRLGHWFILAPIVLDNGPHGLCCKKVQYKKVQYKKVQYKKMLYKKNYYKKVLKKMCIKNIEKTELLTNY